jgi:hypothetical protein
VSKCVISGRKTEPLKTWQDGAAEDVKPGTSRTERSNLGCDPAKIGGVTQYRNGTASSQETALSGAGESDLPFGQKSDACGKEVSGVRLVGLHRL